MTEAHDFELRVLETAVKHSDELVRSTLEALCRRDGISLDSAVTVGEPARNYELALRLGIGHVFGLGQPLNPPAR